ncbi:MAG: aminoacyl--tRNA ligase-related protein [Patescibacteria group bacterium]
MEQSTLFPKTQHTPPRDEISRNAQLLERAGYVSKLFAGVYTYLPLGWKVLKNVERIIREEMNAIGGQELFMPALHPIENYQTTGRDSIDVLFHLTLANEKKLVLGQSHEEIIVPLVKKYIKSHKDLPLYLYQIQTKFRNELRAKSGILRGREFIMKDLYSFHQSTEDFEEYYARAAAAYRLIFARAGIGPMTYYTYASGGTFSEFSHEFQTVTPAGEDIIHRCEKCSIAINDEIIKTQPTCPQCGSASLKTEKAIEVGNIFPLLTKFSDPFGLQFTDADGSLKPVIMGCYGIGLGRLMGTVAEVHSTETGLRWPAAITPFQVHVLGLGKHDDIRKKTKIFSDHLENSTISVLSDDRDISAGSKFADADLIGIPVRAVISEKNGAQVELRCGHDAQPELVSTQHAVNRIKDFYA